MHRPGADPDHMAPEDFLCDFCRSPWAPDRPMVEGHRGSLICAPCLTVAYAQVVRRSASSAPPDARCTLCLQVHGGAAWSSPAFPDAVACLRCLRQAAAILSKDPDARWQPPPQ